MQPSRSGLATRRIALIGALIGALGGCATKAPPKIVTPARPSARPTPSARLAVLPSDRLLFPELATALDDQLDRARVTGAGPSVRANVSMEVAQLSLECVSPSDDCYSQVGKFLQVDRLLWGQIARDSPSAGVTVSVVLLDVGRGAVVARAAETFARSEAAIQGVRALVDKATAAPSAATPAASALSRGELAP